MANIKFSGFTEVTSISGIQEIVGYNGTQNVRITPANFLSSLPGGPFLPLTGGTMTGVLKLNDGVVLQIGSSADLQLFHETNNSFISNFIGDLTIRNLAADKDTIFQADNGAGGVATYFYLDGSITETRFSKSTRHSDNIIAKFGDGNDLQIYHNSSNDRGYIYNATGDLYIENDATDSDIKFFSDNGSGGTTEYFRVDGGQVETVVFKDFNFEDNVKAKFGSSADLQIYHDGSNSSYITSTTSDIYLRNEGDNDRIFIQAKRSGTLANYLTIDGGAVNLFFDGSKKFETTSTGITTTGNITATSSGNTQIIVDGGGPCQVDLLNAQSEAYLRTTTAHDLYFRTANINRMVITADGNVGIGITPPVSKLHVYQNGTEVDTDAGVTIEQDGTGDAALSFLLSSVRRWKLGIDNSDSDKFKISSATNLESNNKLTIDVDGKVGIGTASPQQRLQVGDGSFDAVTRNVFSDGEYVDIHGFGLYMSRGESYIRPTNQATQTLNIGSSSNKWSTIDANAVTHRFLNGGSEKMRIDSSGNLSIGSTANVGYRLKVEGAGTVQLNNRTGSDGAVFAAAKDGTIVGSITVTSSATAFNTSSDYRLKEDLKDFEGLDLVSKIPVYDFKWKTDEKRSYGVMAHELQEVLSDAVNGEKDAEEMQGVDYSKIVPLLIKSIQELSAKVTVLENA